MNNIAATLLLMSGMSALIYQVVWLRLLGLSIGMTSAAVGAVLAAVFFGMALGSWLVGRLPSRWQGRWRTFAVAEGLVGVSALLLLPLLLNLDQLMALMPEWGSQLWFRFAIATLLLALPAGGLGAAYPLVVSIALRNNPTYRGGLGVLYAMHTIGAVVGVLLAALVLIPWWGVDGALYAAVCINLLVALSAMRCATTTTAVLNDGQLPSSHEISGKSTGLLVLAVTGLSGVAVQVGWTKYLSIYTGVTFHGYALLLAFFLTGIAAGSWAGKWLMRRYRFSLTWLSYGLLALGLSLFLTRSGLGMVPALATYIEGLQLRSNAENVLRYGVVLIALVPSAVIFGALFPLSLRCYGGEGDGRTRRVAHGYAANTLAGLVGAGVAGIWLIPTYGTDTLLVIIALLVTLSAMAVWFASGRGRYRLTLPLAVLVVALIGPALPKIDFEKMILCIECSEGAYRQGGEPKFLFLREGRSGVVSLVTYDGENIILENNGLQESRILPQRPNKSEVLLAMLPHLFKPEAKSAFVLGYGGGMSTEVLSKTKLESIRVVELEPAIVEAMRSYKQGEIPVLKDPRVKLDFNDARNTLLLEPARYDIIASQPSHPWRAGSATVFTKEFFRIVHSRLTPGGVFSQWLNLYQIDATSLKSVLRAFYEEFPRGVIFSNKEAPDLFLLGSDEPLELDYKTVSELVTRPEMEFYSWAISIRRPVELLNRYYLMTREEALSVAGDTPANSDLNLLSELRVVAEHEKLKPADDPRKLLERFATR